MNIKILYLLISFLMAGLIGCKKTPAPTPPVETCKELDNKQQECEALKKDNAQRCDFLDGFCVERDRPINKCEDITGDDVEKYCTVKRYAKEEPRCEKKQDGTCGKKEPTAPLTSFFKSVEQLSDPNGVQSIRNKLDKIPSDDKDGILVAGLSGEQNVLHKLFNQNFWSNDLDSLVKDIINSPEVSVSIENALKVKNEAGATPVQLMVANEKIANKKELALLMIEKGGSLKDLITVSDKPYALIDDVLTSLSSDMLVSKFNELDDMETNYIEYLVKNNKKELFEKIYASENLRDDKKQIMEQQYIENALNDGNVIALLESPWGNFDITSTVFRDNKNILDKLIEANETEAKLKSDRVENIITVIYNAFINNQPGRSWVDFVKTETKNKGINILGQKDALALLKLPDVNVTVMKGIDEEDITQILASIKEMVKTGDEESWQRLLNNKPLEKLITFDITDELKEAVIDLLSYNDNAEKILKTWDNDENIRRVLDLVASDKELLSKIFLLFNRTKDALLAVWTNKKIQEANELEKNNAVIAFNKRYQEERSPEEMAKAIILASLPKLPLEKKVTPIHVMNLTKVIKEVNGLGIKDYVFKKEMGYKRDPAHRGPLPYELALSLKEDLKMDGSNRDAFKNLIKALKELKPRPVLELIGKTGWTDYAQQTASKQLFIDLVRDRSDAQDIMLLKVTTDAKSQDILKQAQGSIDVDNPEEIKQSLRALMRDNKEDLIEAFFTNISSSRTKSTKVLDAAKDDKDILIFVFRNLALDMDERLGIWVYNGIKNNINKENITAAFKARWQETAHEAMALTLIKNALDESSKGLPGSVSSGAVSVGLRSLEALKNYVIDNAKALGISDYLKQDFTLWNMDPAPLPVLLAQKTEGNKLKTDEGFRDYIREIIKGIGGGDNTYLKSIANHPLFKAKVKDEDDAANLSGIRVGDIVSDQGIIDYFKRINFRDFAISKAKNMVENFILKNSKEKWNELVIALQNTDIPKGFFGGAKLNPISEVFNHLPDSVDPNSPAAYILNKLLRAENSIVDFDFFNDIKRSIKLLTSVDLQAQSRLFELAPCEKGNFLMGLSSLPEVRSGGKLSEAWKDKLEECGKKPNFLDNIVRLIAEYAKKPEIDTDKQVREKFNYLVRTYLEKNINDVSTDNKKRALEQSVVGFEDAKRRLLAAYETAGKKTSVDDNYFIRNIGANPQEMNLKEAQTRLRRDLARDSSPTSLNNLVLALRNAGQNILNKFGDILINPAASDNDKEIAADIFGKILLYSENFELDYARLFNNIDNARSIVGLLDTEENKGALVKLMSSMGCGRNSLPLMQAITELGSINKHRMAGVRDMAWIGMIDRCGENNLNNVAEAIFNAAAVVNNEAKFKWMIEQYFAATMGATEENLAQLETRKVQRLVIEINKIVDSVARGQKYLALANAMLNTNVAPDVFKIILEAWVAIGDNNVRRDYGNWFSRTYIENMDNEIKRGWLRDAFAVDNSASIFDGLIRGAYDTGIAKLAGVSLRAQTQENAKAGLRGVALILRAGLDITDAGPNLWRRADVAPFNQFPNPGTIFAKVVEKYITDYKGGQPNQVDSLMANRAAFEANRFKDFVAAMRESVTEAEWVNYTGFRLGQNLLDPENPPNIENNISVRTMVKKFGNYIIGDRVNPGPDADTFNNLLLLRR